MTTAVATAFDYIRELVRERAAIQLDGDKLYWSCGRS